MVGPTPAPPRPLYFVIRLVLFLAITAGLRAESGTPGQARDATSKELAHGPRLYAPVVVHDFGTVRQGEVARYDFKIVNNGDAVLEIKDVKPSCGCTTAAEWTRQIKAGESGLIPIKVETAQFSGNVTKTITVTSNDPVQPQAVLEIKAAIWTPVQISNPVIIFPALTDPAQVLTRSVTISNQVDGQLQISDLHSDKPDFKPELKEVVPGREFELSVTTVPPLADGTHTARISMKSSNPKMPDLSVQAVATVLPPVQVAPTEIILPSAKLASPEKRYVVVLNHRGADLQVSEVKINVEGVELSTIATPDKKQITITLTFPVGFQPEGSVRRFVSGKTNHPGLPTFEVPIVHTGNR